MHRLHLTLLPLLLTVATVGCTSSSGNRGSECSGPGDCSAGETCVDGYCRTLCNSVADCDGLRDVCDNGVCLPPMFDDCELDVDCRAPGACETSLEAICLGGGCVYQRLPCETPQVDECFAGDGWYRAFGTPGICGPPHDRCEYEIFEYECPSCETTCKVDCAALDCSDDAGGCRISSHCNPGPPVACSYTQAANGDACSLPGDDPLTEGGRCSDGDCIRPTQFCSEPTDCADFETCVGTRCLYDDDVACTANEQCVGTCIADRCAPPSAVGGSCDGPTDDDDCDGQLVCTGTTCFVADGGDCAANSDCLEVCVGGVCTGAAGNGEPCDAGEDDDCVADHACSNETCRKVDGQGCTDNVECANTCIGGSCTAQAAPGSTCDDADDCAANTTSVDCPAGVCVLADGGTCTANDQCAATCIGGSCAALAGPQSSCDIGQDVDCVTGLICDNGVCRMPNGDSCTANDDCISRECECTNATCTESLKVCAADDCDCRYGTNGTCTIDLNSGVDDPEDCVAVGMGCYQGGCRADSQGSCACACGTTTANCTNIRITTNNCNSGWGPACSGGTCLPIFSSCIPNPAPSCGCTNPI